MRFLGIPTATSAALMLVGLILWPPLAIAGAPGGLASHQGVYRMSLAERDLGSGVVWAEGALLFRFADQCDGWTSELSSDLRIDYGEEEDVHVRWTFASWEAKDGLTFRFRSREWEAGEDTPRLIEGNASLDAIGGGGRAAYSQPVASIVELPVGTLFPTHHLRALIAVAERGERFLSVPLFDGSSPDHTFTVSAVIQPLDPASRRHMASALALPEVPAWRMSLAYFAPLHHDQAPDFALTVRYRQDGVTDRLVQDYGDYSVAVAIEQFDLLADNPCAP